MMKVKIVKSSSEQFWYNDHIGAVVEVEDRIYFHGEYDVVDCEPFLTQKDRDPEVCGLGILIEDCEVIEP